MDPPGARRGKSREYEVKTRENHENWMGNDGKMDGKRCFSKAEKLFLEVQNKRDARLGDLVRGHGAWSGDEPLGAPEGRRSGDEGLGGAKTLLFKPF